MRRDEPNQRSGSRKKLPAPAHAQQLLRDDGHAKQRNGLNAWANGPPKSLAAQNVDRPIAQSAAKVQAGKLEGLASLSSKIDELTDFVRSLKSRARRKRLSEAREVEATGTATM